MTWTFNASVPFGHVRFSPEHHVDAETRKLVEAATQRWLNEVHDLIDPDKRRLGRPSETTAMWFSGSLRQAR